MRRAGRGGPEAPRYGRAEGGSESDEMESENPFWDLSGEVHRDLILSSHYLAL